MMQAKQLEVENVVIIGSGPAGYTAALYAARANLKPVVFEGVTVGPPGGQLMTTTEVENFPGFPDGLTGPELMTNMRLQAEKWGSELYTEDVEKVDFTSRPFTITSDSRTVKAHSVIIATGATAQRLRLPSEDIYWSAGVSACAICDGAAPMFRGARLGVVGGGDSATEEAIYLTKYSADVHLFVRGAEMRASKTLVDRVLANKKITVHYNSVIQDVYGSGKDTAEYTNFSDSPLQGVRVVDTETKELRDVPLRGLFYAIGHKPNTGLFKDQPGITLDRTGYIVVKPGTVETGLAGVFAAGDVQDKEWRQAITAAGTGCQAGLSAERYLVHEGLVEEVHLETAAGEGGGAAAAAGAAAEEDPSKAKKLQEFDINRTSHVGSIALRKLYHESERPLLVKYAAPSCGPCRSLGPILAKLVAEFEGRIHYVEIDIEESPEIAESAGVSSTPTVQLFKDKGLLQNVRGVKRKSEYREMVQAALDDVAVY
ncbi:unnamed protein product [Heterosigma akashiwo]